MRQWLRARAIVAVFSAAQLLTGCGTVVPQLHEAWEPVDARDPTWVQRIKQSVYCELRVAVLNHKGDAAGPNGTGEAIPDDWGAQLTLSLQVDETGALNPGATISRGLGGSDLFSIGLGASVSSQATRIDKYYSFFSAAQLKVPFRKDFDTECHRFDGNGKNIDIDHTGSSPLISGNLGIDAWLDGALIQQYAIPSSDKLRGSFTKLDVISYDVKFLVITSASVSPTAKFVNVTAGTGTPFVSANRTRTHEIILTLGPVDTSVVTTKKGKKEVISPNLAAQNLHLANEIGQSVAAAIRLQPQNLFIPQF